MCFDGLTCGPGNTFVRRPDPDASGAASTKEDILLLDELEEIGEAHAFIPYPFRWMSKFSPDCISFIASSKEVPLRTGIRNGCPSSFIEASMQPMMKH